MIFADKNGDHEFLDRENIEIYIERKTERKRGETDRDRPSSWRRTDRVLIRLSKCRAMGLAA